MANTSGIEATRFSRISTGYISSSKSVVGKYAFDTSPDFSCIYGVAQSGFTVKGTLGVTSNISVTGTLDVTGAGTFYSTTTHLGAATFQSTVTARGLINADAGIQVGGGQVMQVLSTSTAAISFGSIGVSGGISSTTVALSGLSRLDDVLVAPDSIWFNTAGNRGIAVYASSGSTVGEANVWAVNSGLTAITPTASSVFRFTRVKFGNYPAA